MWLILILILLAAALVWFIRQPDDGSQPRHARPPTDDVDYEELERAEREVQSAASEEDVKDWGPGAPRPGPPPPSS